MRIPCTCGCGQKVTYATKTNHLNGRGKTSLRARVLEENESLRRSTRQQPVLLQDHQKKKRSHPSSNQTGNRKRLKADQLDVDLPAQAYADPMESLPTLVPNQGPESPIQTYTDLTELPPTSAPNQEPEFAIQAYTDPTELPHTPVPSTSQVPEIPPVQASTDITESTPTLVPNQAPEGSPVSQADAGPEELPPAPEPDSEIEDGSADALSSARRSNKIAERTREVTKQRWGNNHLRDEIPKSDGGGGGYRSEDEEDVDLNMTSDEDSYDEDREDDDEDREDDDDDLFAESGVTGISAWDLLGEGFEREVASIGMSLAQDSSVSLTIF